MKTTVSTLCATSTLGIAGCGFALARPDNDANDEHLTSRRPSPLPNSKYLSIIHDPPRSDRSNGASTPDSLQLPMHSSPSKSRKWIRRLSESFSSSDTSYHSATSSPGSYRTRSQSSSQPSSRPSTRNKLVKRSPSQRLSRTGSPVSPSPARPSTALFHRPRGRSSLHWNRDDSRPSTSSLMVVAEDTTQKKNAWFPFFRPKRRKENALKTHASRLTRSTGGVRRIFPAAVDKRQGPTLVMASDLTSSAKVFDNASILSDDGYLESRPASMQGQGFDPRRWSSPNPPGMGSPRKSFSIANFWGRPGSSGRRSLSRDSNQDFYSNDRPPTSRRQSTPLPHYRYARPTTSDFHDPERGPLPAIRSVSLLELNVEAEQEVPYIPSPILDEAVSPMTVFPAPNIDNVVRQNRLSVLSASEHASTLVGSESEHDFGSETVFDSLRTRISEITPVRVENIFKSDGPSASSSRQVSVDSTNMLGIVTADDLTPKRSKGSREFRSQRSKISINDSESQWSSDWDALSKAFDDEEPRGRHFVGLRPSGTLLLGSHTEHSNTSKTTFGTAPERFSIDGTSSRDSVLDWNDGMASSSGSQSPATPRALAGFSEKANYFGPSPKVARRVPSYHARSQSMPVVSKRPKLPMSSENWDDDFLDDQDETVGVSGSEMVIPRAIEERQASVIGHLGCVREFALLVEDLKHLRNTAIANNLRGTHEHLWDEAEGIIALASLEDDEEDAPLRRDSLHRQNTWAPGLESISGSDFGSMKRRTSVLPLDDDIFGGSTSGTNPRRSVTSSPMIGTPVSPKIGAPVSPRLPSSPLIRSSTDKSDPVESAKTLMEKMQQRQGTEHLLSSSYPKTGKGKNGGKVHFDTNMLRELVIRVASLKDELAKIVERHANNHVLESLPRLLTKVSMHGDESFDLDISPVAGSIDESFGAALDGPARNGPRMEFAPVFGIA